MKQKIKRYLLGLEEFVTSGGGGLGSGGAGEGGVSDIVDGDGGHVNFGAGGDDVGLVDTAEVDTVDLVRSYQKPFTKKSDIGTYK